MTPEVDVVIAVHTDRRPIERATASALQTTRNVRVTVVAHNVGPEAIRARLGVLADDPRVRVIPLSDGMPSPAGPFNHGLSAATATYTAILGSDDEFESGAIDAWVALAERTGADVVVAPVVRDGGAGIPTPRIRRRRAGRILDGDRDRLFERSAALGLHRRATTGGVAFDAGLTSGEDQRPGLELWFGRRTVFDPVSPAYLEHGDQGDRVTHRFGVLADDFAFLTGLDDVLASLSAAARRGVAAKILRVHLVPALRVRAAAGTLTDADVSAAADVIASLQTRAPGAEGLLPRDAGVIVDAVRSGRAADVRRLAQARSTRLDSLLSARLVLALHRHAPLRTQWAGRRVARTVTAAHAKRSAR